MSDYISRADAIEAVASITMSIHLSDVICDKLLALPSADAVSYEDWSNLVEEYNNTIGAILAVISAPTGIKEISDHFAELIKEEQTDSVVRCKDCRHGWYDDDIEYYVCRHPKGLNEELYGVDYCSYGQTKEQTEYKLPGHDEVMEALDKLTIRPHGKWIFREVPIVRGGTSFGYVCSNCGKDYWQVEGMDYCPNCGADMRGDSND